MTPYGPVDVSGSFGGTYCYHLHGRNISQSNQQTCCLLTSYWLLDRLTFFDPDDGSMTFLWNIGKFLSDNTAFIVTAMRTNIFSYSRYYAMTVRWVVIPAPFLGNGSVNTFPRQWKTVSIREWTMLPKRSVPKSNEEDNWGNQVSWQFFSHIYSTYCAESAITVYFQ
jgi:hypothetical protein